MPKAIHPTGGKFSPNSNAGITGTANTGPYTGGTPGTLVMNVPLADVGNPPATSQLTNTFADTHAALTVAGGGLYYTSAADRAQPGLPCVVAGRKRVLTNR
jgi:hypothetical protein